MSIQLKIGSSVIGGTVNPTPAVSITRKGVHHPVTGALEAVEHTWDVKGVLLYKAGGDDIPTQVGTLEGLFAGLDGTETVQLVDGAVVLAQLVGANAIEGLKIDPPSFIDGSGVEWATKRTYSLRFTAQFAASGVTEWAEFTLTTMTDERGIDSRLLDGVYHKPTSTDIEADCKTYVASLLPEDEQLYKRSESYAKDGQSASSFGKSCRFTVSDAGLWKAMPAGCSSASVTKTVNRKIGTGRVMALSGSFTGKDRNMQSALDAVNSLLAQYAHLPKMSEDISENEYEGTVTFSASFLDHESTTIEYRQQVTIEAAFGDFVMQPILDGLPPVRQDTVLRSATASQSGYAVMTVPATPEAPIWPNNIRQRPAVTYSEPEKDIDDKAMTYRVDWNYQFEFETTPIFRVT